MLSISLLLAGDLLGVFPRYYDHLIGYRKKFCESLALHFSLAAERRDVGSVRRLLEAVVERNPDVIGATIVRSDGLVVARAGTVPESLRAVDPEGEPKSSSGKVRVPIYYGPAPWGAVDVLFDAPFGTGVLGLWLGPFARLAGFLALTSFGAYFLFLRRSLRHLDPMAVVPARVRSTLDILAEGVILVDHTGVIVLANSSFAEIVGEPAEGLVGRDAGDFDWVASAASQKNGFPWQQAISHGSVLIRVPLKLRAGKGTRSLAVNACPILGERDRVQGAVATFEDMTRVERTNDQLSRTVTLLKKSRDEVDRKNRDLEATNRHIEAKVEERTAELQRSKEEAEAASRAKSIFLANISHELRTPMHAVLSFSQFGMRKIDSAEKDKLLGYFEKINDSGKNLLTLLDDLLDLSKLHAGKMTYDMQEADIMGVVDSVVSELQQMAAAKAIHVDVVEPDLETRLIIDEFRIAQVVRNVLANAIKFSREKGVIMISFGSGTIEIGSRTIDSLEVSVADEGIGIPPEELEQIFEPFTQSARTETGAGGTGLGLPICREILKAHHGWIRARNRAERGAVVTFALPLVPMHDLAR